MLQEGLNKFLASAAAVTAIVGVPSARTDRTNGIFPVLMPKEAPLPAIVLMQISGAPEADSMDGSNALHSARMQVSCYGVTQKDAKSLARAVRATLEGFSGQLPDGTVVQHCGMLLEMDHFEEAPFVYHVPVDFEFVYLES